MSQLCHLSDFSKLSSPQQEVRNLGRFLVLLSGASYHCVFNTFVPWESNGKRIRSRRIFSISPQKNQALPWRQECHSEIKLWQCSGLEQLFRMAGECVGFLSLPCREEPIKGVECLPDFERSVFQADFSYIFLHSLAATAATVLERQAILKAQKLLLSQKKLPSNQV